MAPRSQPSRVRRWISSSDRSYGRPRRFSGQLPFRERAELAFEVTDVGVVDVAIDDVADDIAVHELPDRIGRVHDRGEIVAARVEQTDDFAFGQILAALRAFDDLRHFGGRRYVRTADRGQHVGGRTHRFARRPAVGARQSRCVDQFEHFVAQRFGEPDVGTLYVFRIDRQALVQQLAGARGFATEFFEVRPRRFGVDEVGRKRRHAAPVVDAGRDDLRQHAGAQVRRRLDAHVGAEHDPRDRDGPQQFVEIGLRRVAHLRAFLRTKVLHDDFLNVSVLGVHCTQCEQRLDAFEPRFADADQNAGRERHARGTGAAQRIQAHLRNLVRRAVVRHAFLAEPGRGGLEHDAHRRRYLAQQRELRIGHRAGICVRQQPGFVEHRLRGGVQILERRRVSHLRERFARGLVAQFGFFTEREQRFLAAERFALPRHFEHLFDRHERCTDALRSLRKCAVVAHVAAQMGQRNEYFPRIGHEVAEAAVAQLRGDIGELSGVGLGRERQCVAVGRYSALQRCVQQCAGGCTHECSVLQPEVRHRGPRHRPQDMDHLNRGKAIMQMRQTSCYTACF